ncbi:histidine triad nucleotide-binding protein [Alicyclobacillus tolerans]|uniref:histidine triad nucleotide-binding protein n=1 Tax=Alicyclobacillus tolerans TaxID=90970 RepID=UPI001F32F08C|nr:histidine triad nucleotide-binding protein [Alicyclobacillus tolerans]MCF8565271.1 histidine triad nucleotide-binding protein [Alicyclobacillus tolerans]
MDDCLFCKIVKGDIPSNKVLETEDALAFHDIRPQAPVHVLVIPKKHIASALTLEEDDVELVGRLHLVAKQVAKDLGLDEQGYRMVTNIGWYGQQTVPHLHYHVLGGRQLSWPPG